MATKKNIHTVKNKDATGKRDKWAVKKEGQNDPLSVHKTKEAAEEAGRKQAKKDEVEHVIHKMDGTIAEKDSYGNDPFPPKDGK